MRRAVVLAVLLLAAPAAGGELIRFRAADGTIGLVDHPSKLPPGATVLKLSKPTERAPDPEPAPARRRRAFRPSPPAQQSESAEKPIAPSSSDSWCRRGRAAEDRIARAGDRLVMAEEYYDRCHDGGRVDECSRSRLDSAETEVENAQQAQNDLEADCRRSGCDPGWLRCGP